MIKVKVFKTNQTWALKGTTSYVLYDFVYCVYLFGYLIHSVNVYNIDKGTALRMFKGYTIIEDEV